MRRVYLVALIDGRWWKLAEVPLAASATLARLLTWRWLVTATVRVEEEPTNGQK